MSARIRHHIRSNVIGYMALFVALSGTAYATHPGGANTISSGDIIDNVIRSEDIRDGNVTSAELRTGSVVTGKVLDDTFPEGGLTAPDLAPGSVGSSELQTNAIPANGFGDDGSTKLGDNSVNFNELAPDSIEGSKVEDESLNGADIDESSLGTVPDADKLDGQDSTAFAPAAQVHVTGPVLVEVPDSISDPPNTQTLLSNAWFTVHAECSNIGGSDARARVNLEVESPVAGSSVDVGGDPAVLSAGNFANVADTGIGGGVRIDHGLFSAFSAEGSLEGVVAANTFLWDSGCGFSGSALG